MSGFPGITTRSQAAADGQELPVGHMLQSGPSDQKITDRKAPITHRGKPPAMPGDLPRFDLYDGRSDSPSLRQKTQEITNERVSESESYEVGL